MKHTRSIDAVTVTLNPAVDRTLIIPHFRAGKVNRVESSSEIAGGKGVNVATALADFGLSVAVTGFLGTENIAIFESLFSRKKIIDHFVRINGSTRVGIKVVDPTCHETTDINFPGLTPARSDLSKLLQQIERVGNNQPTWFVLAGSLPPQVDMNIYQQIISRLKKQGHKTVLDTSGEPLAKAIEAAPHVIKPNIHELEALAGKPLKTDRAIIRAARDINERGVELVVVSMAERGALFITAERVVKAVPPKIRVRSTVGAGDAMVAGIVAAQLRGQSLEDCARLGTAFSLQTLTRVDRSIGSRRETGAWMKKISVL